MNSKTKQNSERTCEGEWSLIYAKRGERVERGRCYSDKPHSFNPLIIPHICSSLIPCLQFTLKTCYSCLHSNRRGKDNKPNNGMFSMLPTTQTLRYQNPGKTLIISFLCFGPLPCCPSLSTIHLVIQFRRSCKRLSQKDWVWLRENSSCVLSMVISFKSWVISSSNDLSCKTRRFAPSHPFSFSKYTQLCVSRDWILSRICYQGMFYMQLSVDVKRERERERERCDEKMAIQVIDEVLSLPLLVSKDFSNWFSGGWKRLLHRSSPSSDTWTVLLTTNFSSLKFSSSLCKEDNEEEEQGANYRFTLSHTPFVWLHETSERKLSYKDNGLRKLILTL